MRLSLILGICAAFLFTVPAGFSLAQTGSKSEPAARGGKSAQACQKCCSENQIKMGLPPKQVELCIQRCMVGTGRNC